jgi:hypothetical protein
MIMLEGGVRRGVNSKSNEQNNEIPETYCSNAAAGAQLLGRMYGVPFLTAGQRTPYGLLRKLTRPFRI